MTHSKNFAYDGKGAVAGDAAPLPEKDNADTLGVSLQGVTTRVGFHAYQ
jgi:hypothetical protein